MKKLTILISASASPTAPGLIDCIKHNGEREVWVVGMDMCSDPSAQCMVDVFYQVPSATADNYCDVVLEICKKEQVDIYFPNISAEVSAVASRKDEFEALGTIISVSNQHSVKLANNKLKMYEMLREKGIEVPKFYGVHSVDDFIRGCKELGYPSEPVCLKIVDGSGSRGVRVIDAKRNRYQIFVSEKPNSLFVSYEDMLSILKEADDFHEMLLVEYMPGTEYTVDALAENGKTLYMVGRENTVSLMSIAQDSTVKEDDEAYLMSRAVIEALQYSGNIGFDFMRDKNGKAVLMDINPRITATVSVIAAAGVNLPYLRIKQLLGEELPALNPRYGTRMRRRYGEIYTDANGNRITIG